MKVIVCGGRSYEPDGDHLYRLGLLLKSLDPEEVFSGGANGADKIGETWAMFEGVTIRKFPANWNNLGLRAGPIRNAQMVKDADAVIALPGGTGTKDVLSKARKKGISVYVLGKEGN